MRQVDAETAQLVTASFGLFLMFAFAWFFVAGFFRSPFVPSNRKTVQKMLEVAKIKKGQRVLDLGCGDGRLLFGAERKYGAIATGYEISIFVWLLAQLNRILRGSKARILRQNFFAADLAQADVVFCYLLPEVMKVLAPKFKKELKPGARVVSAAFRLPGWKIEKEYLREGCVAPIFVYRK